MARAYKIWDKQNDELKKGWEDRPFNTIEDAEAAIADLIVDEAYDGNGGFEDATEEEVEEYFNGMDDHQIMVEDDYEVREVED